MPEDNPGRNSLIPPISKDRLSEDPDVFHDLQFLDKKDTSIEARRASFRRVLDNAKGNPPEEAYKDIWRLGIRDGDLKIDEISSYGGSSTGGESQNNKNSANGFAKSKRLNGSNIYNHIKRWVTPGGQMISYFNISHYI